MADRQTCEATKPDGTPCRAVARTGSRYCWFHDPEIAASRAAARRAGRQTRSRRAAVLPPGTPDVPLASVSDVVKLQGMVINRVLRGEIDARVGNAVGYLSGVMLKALTDAELERRIEMLEQRWAGSGNEPTR